MHMTFTLNTSKYQNGKIYHVQVSGEYYPNQIPVKNSVFFSCGNWQADFKMHIET